ncbi:MAG: SMC-Scp complex subunit ScpB, partial [Lachnospirales bacterium]
RLDAPGRPILFGTTDEFLRFFGFNALDNLPVSNLDDEQLRLEAEAEIGSFTD